MKGAVTDKNTFDKGKDVVPNEEEIPSPRTSTTRLMAIEESMVYLNDRNGNLVTIKERLARRLEVALTAHFQQQEIVNGNHQELWCIAS